MKDKNTDSSFSLNILNEETISQHIFQEIVNLINKNENSEGCTILCDKEFNLTAIQGVVNKDPQDKIRLYIVGRRIMKEGKLSEEKEKLDTKSDVFDLLLLTRCYSINLHLRASNEILTLPDFKLPLFINHKNESIRNTIRNRIRMLNSDEWASVTEHFLQTENSPVRKKIEGKFFTFYENPVQTKTFFQMKEEAAKQNNGKMKTFDTTEISAASLCSSVCSTNCALVWGDISPLLY